MNYDAVLAEQQRTINDLAFQVAELHRRLASVVQVGTVKSFDGQKGTVVDVGYTTHNIPGGWHAGTGVDWAPFKVGQQITMLCPSGDPANAVLFPGGYHDKNPPPSADPGTDIRAQRGAVGQPNRLRTTDGGSYLEALGNTVAVEEGKITITADKIILVGDCYLGGADATTNAARLGTVDTGGYADVANLATKVFVK